MKVKAISKRSQKAFVVFVIFFLCAEPGFSGTGGGSGIPRSLFVYGNPPYEANEHTVASLKEKSSRIKYVLITRPGGQTIREKDIGLAYVNDEGIQGEVHFAFSGTDERGCKLKIDFSEVENFSVLGKQSDLIVLKVSQFPTITPKELIEKKPSYRELRSKYKRNVQIRVSTREASGSRLYLVAKKLSEGSDYKLLMPLEDIKMEHYIEFSPYPSYDDLWWAIPSVANDPTFPHRVTFRK